MTDVSPRPQPTPCAPCAERAARAGLRELRPDTLAPEVVPRHAPGLGHWKRGGDVVVSRDGGPEHVLNASAATIWLSLDGVVSVGELVEALHEQTGAPRDVIDRDVRSAVVRMAGIGLLVVDLAG